MGSPQNCYLTLRIPHLIIPFLFLLLSSSTHMQFLAQGRPVTKLVEATEVHNEKEEWEKKMMIRSEVVIGSTPPRCERRCRSCGHCEAVQVPVTSRILSHKRSSLSTGFSGIADSRGQDISNYKPMSWKCKCGNLIFTP
ncbi:EPIDERMAL PATTERNING FACTOR-like protein 2 [Euphorbia peplus]|nr:EPIDERMAL PATTERNING FACTOR-like protein 2 [Euphorbia peplus]